MDLHKTYFFFLIITTIGALLTIKICNTAYAVYDYSDLDSTTPTITHHSKTIQQPGADGLID